ncbi:MAG: hypothetical protein Q7J48_02700 [Nocardioides sp.]|nr:hypothetical protein [Nocardioides sp.]
MTPPRRRLAALALVAPLMLAACGEDADPASTTDRSDDTSTSPTPTEATEATEATEPSTSAAEDECVLLPAEAVTTALGEDMVVSASGPQSCLFGPGDPASAASITAAVTELAIDPEEYAAGSRELCEGEITDVDAGDEAFACVTFVGPQGFVFEGSTSVVLDVTTGDESEPAAIAAAAALLPSVVVP